MIVAAVLVAGCMTGGDDPQEPRPGNLGAGVVEPADTSVPDTDARTVGADAADTRMSGADAADTRMPGADAADTRMPGADAADTRMPGTDAADTWMPGADAADTRMPGADVADTGIPAEASYDASGRIVEACQGMKLVGMKYSPGGSVLPNKCAPFDVRNNNPFAVRCIDAMPDFATPFPGDEYCILPPPPDLGLQLGVHPGGNIGYWEKMWAGDYSFYADPAVTAEYELPAGSETSQNYDVAVEVPSGERYYYRRHFRARYGSHHGRAAWPGFPVTEGWKPDNLIGAILGTELINLQNAYTDIPERSMDISPEETGIGFQLPQGSGVTFNLHHFNATDEVLLRENWINVWYLTSGEVTRLTGIIYGQAPAIDYPPGMVLDNEVVIPPPLAASQILNMFGHRHAWTTRFHAWIVRADGTEELVYDSHDWKDMPTFAYNSATVNPEPGAGHDGAVSGPLVLQLGDALHFNCHVETTPERAAVLGVPAPNTTLRWANEAITGEMCSLTATVVPVPAGGLPGGN